MGVASQCTVDKVEKWVLRVREQLTKKHLVTVATF